MSCPTMGNGIPKPCTAIYQKWTDQPLYSGRQQESPVFRHGECQTQALKPDEKTGPLFKSLKDVSEEDDILSCLTVSVAPAAEGDDVWTARGWRLFGKDSFCSLEKCNNELKRGSIWNKI